MSQLSLAFDSSLLVRDSQGRYMLATADQILEAARQVIDQKIPRGALFTSPTLVKDYLRTKLAGFEYEVFAALFLDSQHRLIEYAELFRGTIDSAAVYPREVVKTALRLNAAAVIFCAQPSEREPRAESGRQTDHPAAQGCAGAGGRARTGSHRCRRRVHSVLRRTGAVVIAGASAPFLLRPMPTISGPAGLRAPLACPCLRWRSGWAVLLFPSPYHGVLAVKGGARLARWRPGGRLRPCDCLRCAVLATVPGNSAPATGDRHHERQIACFTGTSCLPCLRRRLRHWQPSSRQAPAREPGTPHDDRLGPVHRTPEAVR